MKHCSGATPSFRQYGRSSSSCCGLSSKSTSLVKSLASLRMNAPARSTFPVMARRQQMARCVGATDLPTWSMPRPLTSAVRPCAKMRAARTMSAGGTSQNSPVYSGVKGFTCSASSSKPWHHSSTNARSSRPSLMMTLSMPRASVQSVPGLGASHRSAQPATCVKRGSTHTSVMSSDLPAARMVCQNAELSDCAGFVPQMNSASVTPNTMLASPVQPNVMASIQMRGFQQIWPMPMLLGLPNKFMKRCSGQKLACGPPIMLASVPGPCSSRSAVRRRAMSSSASSQLTRSHSPEPRSPTRRSGWFTRRGESSTSRFMRQRRQPARMRSSYG